MSVEVGELIQTSIQNDLGKEIIILGIVSKTEDKNIQVTVVEAKKHGLPSLMSFHTESQKISKLDVAALVSSQPKENSNFKNVHTHGAYYPERKAIIANWLGNISSEELREKCSEYAFVREPMIPRHLQLLMHAGILLFLRKAENRTRNLPIADETQGFTNEICEQILLSYGNPERISLDQFLKWMKDGYLQKLYPIEEQKEPNHVKRKEKSIELKAGWYNISTSDPIHILDSPFKGKSIFETVKRDQVCVEDWDENWIRISKPVEGFLKREHQKDLKVNFLQSDAMNTKFEGFDAPVPAMNAHASDVDNEVVDFIPKESVPDVEPVLEREELIPNASHTGSGDDTNLLNVSAVPQSAGTSSNKTSEHVFDENDSLEKVQRYERSIRKNSMQHERQIVLKFIADEEEPWGFYMNFSETTWNRWKVVKVEKGMQADKLGVQPGWQIVKVEMADARDMRYEYTLDDSSKISVEHILTSGPQCSITFKEPCIQFHSGDVVKVNNTFMDIEGKQEIRRGSFLTLKGTDEEGNLKVNDAMHDWEGDCVVCFDDFWKLDKIETKRLRYVQPVGWGPIRIRNGPGLDFNSIGTVTDQEIITAFEQVGDWIRCRRGWCIACWKNMRCWVYDHFVHDEIESQSEMSLGLFEVPFPTVEELGQLLPATITSNEDEFMMCWQQVYAQRPHLSEEELSQVLGQKIDITALDVGNKIARADIHGTTVWFPRAALKQHERPVFILDEERFRTVNGTEQLFDALSPLDFAENYPSETHMMVETTTELEVTEPDKYSPKTSSRAFDMSDNLNESVSIPQTNIFTINITQNEESSDQEDSVSVNFLDKLPPEKQPVYPESQRNLRKKKHFKPYQEVIAFDSMYGILIEFDENEKVWVLDTQDGSVTALESEIELADDWARNRLGDREYVPAALKENDVVFAHNGVIGILEKDSENGEQWIVKSGEKNTNVDLEDIMHVDAWCVKRVGPKKRPIEISSPDENFAPLKISTQPDSPEEYNLSESISLPMSPVSTYKGKMLENVGFRIGHEALVEPGINFDGPFWPAPKITALIEEEIEEEKRLDAEEKREHQNIRKYEFEEDEEDEDKLATPLSPLSVVENTFSIKVTEDTRPNEVPDTRSQEKEIEISEDPFAEYRHYPQTESEIDVNYGGDDLPDNDPAEEFYDQLFSALDKDHTGKLNAGELRNLYPRLIDDPSVYLLEYFDKSKDGEISRGELRELFDARESGKLDFDLLKERLEEVMENQDQIDEVVIESSVEDAENFKESQQNVTSEVSTEIHDTPEDVKDEEKVVTLEENESKQQSTSVHPAEESGQNETTVEEPANIEKSEESLKQVAEVVPEEKPKLTKEVKQEVLITRSVRNVMQRNCIGVVTPETFDAIDLKRWEIHNVTEELFLEIKDKSGRIIAFDEENDAYYIQLDKNKWLPSEALSIDPNDPILSENKMNTKSKATITTIVEVDELEQNDGGEHGQKDEEMSKIKVVEEPCAALVTMNKETFVLEFMKACLEPFSEEETSFWAGKRVSITKFDAENDLYFVEKGVKTAWIPTGAIMTIGKPKFVTKELKEKPEKAKEITSTEPEYKTIIQPQKRAPIVTRKDQIQYGIYRGHENQVSSCEFFSNEKQILSTGHDGTLRVWDIYTGEERMKIKAHEDKINCTSIGANDTRVCTGSKDSTLKIINPYSGKIIHTLKGHEGEVHACQISENGNFIVSGGQDRTVKLWNSSGYLMQTLYGHKSVVQGVCIGTDNSLIVSASIDNMVKTWDRRSGRDTHTFRGHTDAVYCCALSGSNRYIISGSADKTVRCWDIRMGKCHETYRGHTDFVNACDISSDGNMICSASSDRTIKFWNLNYGGCIKTISGHNSSVHCVKLSRKSNSLVISGSYDHTVRVWNLREKSRVVRY